MSDNDFPPLTLEDRGCLEQTTNIQAEQSLLGALLVNNRWLRECSSIEAAHFADPLHGQLYSLISETIHRGELADVVTLRPIFEHSGILDEVGGPRYILQLLHACPADGDLTTGHLVTSILRCWRIRVSKAHWEGTRLEDRPAIAAQQAAELSTKYVGRFQVLSKQIAELFQEQEALNNRLADDLVPILEVFPDKERHRLAADTYWALQSYKTTPALNAYGFHQSSQVARAAMQ